MLRFLAVFLVLMGSAWADALEQHQEDINLEMCGSVDHRFDFGSNECIYCAQGLVHNQKSDKCEGTVNMLGKCFGEDHYHAATQECMYCAKGFLFDENLRICAESPEASQKE